VKISLVFGRIVELAESLGVQRINELPGCWEHKVDERWRIAVNAHREERKTSTGAAVPPLCCYVEYNGWPAGILRPNGGIIAAGTGANEGTLIAALERAIGPRPDEPEPESTQVELFPEVPR
jgi:hypothetical protein